MADFRRLRHSSRVLADLIKKKRLESGISREEAACQIGVSERAIRDWERHLSEPLTSRLPKIVAFLGFVPDFLQGPTQGERIAMRRMLLGYGRRKLAGLLGVHDTMLERWEKNHVEPPANIEETIDKLLAMSHNPKH